MKRIGFIFLRFLVALYAIVAFPFWILSIILWSLWNIILVIFVMPVGWILVGGLYNDGGKSSEDKYDWLVSLRWWRKKLEWQSWAYDYDLDDIPQWYLYYLRIMSEYCD